MFNDYVNVLSTKYIPHAYKYVASKHYHSARRGGLRISPYQEFHKYEDFRGDPSEGISDYISLGPMSQEFNVSNPFIRSMSTGNVNTFGSIFRHYHPPAFLLCLSSKPDNPGLTTPDSDRVFKLRSLVEIGERISKEYSDRLGDWKVEPVKYQSQFSIGLNGFYQNPNLFQKNPKYSSDEEIRIAWLATSENLYKPFIIEEGLIEDLVIEVSI